MQGRRAGTTHTVALERGALVVGLIAPLLALAATLAPGATAPAAAAPVSVSIDNMSRASVRSAYQNVLAPALATPTGWTGSVSGCNAGATSAAAQDATLTAINWFRELSQLGPVSLDATLNAKAQQAALMFTANNALTHAPPDTWTCYTANGADAASRSNIALASGTLASSASGPRAIALYMKDPGTGNEIVGHRRWILYPPRTVMGVGSTSNANDLVVFGTGTASGTRPAAPLWYPYPTPGYFPAQLEPGGRWSITRNGADFSGATVTVTKNGSALPVTVNPVANGYGDNTLSWQVSPGFTLGGADQKYSVTVANVLVGGSPTFITYDVILFDVNVDVVVPAPTVTTVAPKVGPTTGGGTVTITGTGFTGAAGVRFGPSAASSFTVVDDTTITAVAPARSAGLVNIYVDGPGGANPNQASSWYTYQTPPTNPPTVASLTPNIGPVEGGTTVTITGTGFLTASSVKFGQTNASFQMVNDTTIVATAPARPEGLVNVWVTNGVGTNSNQQSSWYSYRVITGPAPTVTAVGPNKGPAAGGTAVTITGTGFTGAGSVRFGTTNAATFTVVNDTTITAVTPARPSGLVNVWVSTQNGTSTNTSASWFTYQ